MKDKVKIVISDKDEEGNYHEFDTGKRFIDVGFSAKIYGAGTPCISKEDIITAIANCKDMIIREGDIPIVEDNREKNTLAAWS